MSSLLIIGGSGFFGKSILDSYRRGKLQKWQIKKVYVFARNANILEATNPELLGDSVSLINGDIATCNSLPKTDYVIHAAASSDASKYIEAPEVEKNNILAATSNFCTLIMSQDLGASKILYISSGAVYGASSAGQAPFYEGGEFMMLDEMDENKRHYSAAKRDSEAQIIALGKRGASVAIARCFSFIGKYLPRDQHFAIGNFIQNGLDQSPIKVKSQKKVYRSYMYADDLVEWLMTIMENSKEACPVFNVGSDEVIELRDLGAIVANLFDLPLCASVPSTNSPDFYIPSIAKATKELGLKQNYNLRKSLHKTVLLLKNGRKI